MARLAIYSNGPSDSVNALKTEMLSFRTNLIRIRRRNSNFVGRDGDVIINYGSSSMPNHIIGSASVLNSAAAISQSSHKTRAFRRMTEAGVKTVDYTTDMSVAEGWLDAGDLVYSRTVLQGHSGEGIQLSRTAVGELDGLGPIELSNSLVSAPLYTRGITQQRREFRLHVIKGVVVYTQQKRRRDGYREDPNYSNVVRNHHTGWIYANNNVEANDQAKENALRAVAALGLDFGAVDVITRGDEAWVLEVNTAPGMSGTTLSVYAENFQRLLDGAQPITFEALSDTSELSEEIEAEQEPTTYRLDQLVMHRVDQIDTSHILSPSERQTLTYNIISNHLYLPVSQEVQSLNLTQCRTIETQTCAKIAKNVVHDIINVVYHNHGLSEDSVSELADDLVSRFTNFDIVNRTSTFMSALEADLSHRVNDMVVEEQSSIGETRLPYSELVMRKIREVGGNNLTELDAVSVFNKITSEQPAMRRAGLYRGLFNRDEITIVVETRLAISRSIASSAIHGAHPWVQITSPIFQSWVDDVVSRFSYEDLLSANTDVMQMIEGFSDLQPTSGAVDDSFTTENFQIQSEASVTTEREVAQQEVPATTNTSVSSLIDGGVYVLTIDDSYTVGRYEGACNHFEIIGWEVPVEVDDVVVGEHLWTLN